MGAGIMEEGGFNVGNSEKAPGRPMEILEFREEVLILNSAGRGGALRIWKQRGVCSI